MFEKDLAASQFKQPDIFKEKGELERVAETFEIDSSVLVYRAQQGQLRQLNETDWSTLENTDSYDIETGDWDTVERNAFQIGRDWESVKTALETGIPLDAPIIMKRGDQTHLVSGNTRLMVARAMGIRPQVWVFEVDEIR